MNEITIEGYLTEAKLVEVVRTLSGDAWRGGQLKLPNSRRRWDCAFQRADQIVAVEYDGERHYCNSLKIKADREKNALAEKHGMKVIRFPYWIQLTDETLSCYLGMTAKILQDFPHGFITTEWYPASFCELGIDRFRTELDTLPSQVRTDVVESLKQRSAEHGVEYVLPLSLRPLLAPEQ